jgi:hypothetical protein
MHRYRGEWCKKMDEMGNHEYGSVVATSKDRALKLAIAKAKAANECEWVSVTEQEWIGSKLYGHWHTRTRWTGDYESQEQVL